MTKRFREDKVQAGSCTYVIQWGGLVLDESKDESTAVRVEGDLDAKHDSAIVGRIHYHSYQCPYGLWHTTHGAPNGEELADEIEYRFTDIGRKIDISWPGEWNNIIGFKSLNNILLEEVRDLKELSKEEEDRLLLEASKWVYNPEMPLERNTALETLILAHTPYAVELGRKNRGKVLQKVTYDVAIEASLYAMVDVINNTVDMVKDGGKVHSNLKSVMFKPIIGEISKAIREKEPISRASHKKMKDELALSRFRNEYMTKWGVFPNRSEIKSGLGWGDRRLSNTMMIYDPTFIDYENDDYSLQMAEVNEILSDKEKEVINMLFGFNGHEPMSKVKVADELGVHRNTINNLYSSAKMKMRAKLKVF